LPALARHRSPLAGLAELELDETPDRIAAACPRQRWASMAFSCRAGLADSEAGTYLDLVRFMEQHRRTVAMVSIPIFAQLQLEFSDAFCFTVLQTSEFGYVLLAEPRAACCRPPNR
jgi:hypothetical protein